MNDKHFLIVWDADVELPYGPGAYQDLTDNTIPYLFAHCGDPRMNGGWGVAQEAVAANIESLISGFTAFLTTTVAPPNIKIIVCSARDRMRLLMNGKDAIVFCPLAPMGIQDIANWIIRASLLHRYDSLTEEMEECVALLHREEGVKSVADINDLRRMTGEFFDRTLIRWGHYRGQPASSEASGKVAA